eukprot:14105369-Alexandrium_andersonii.AAC.1
MPLWEWPGRERAGCGGRPSSYNDNVVASAAAVSCDDGDDTGDGDGDDGDGGGSDGGDSGDGDC